MDDNYNNSNSNTNFVNTKAIDSHIVAAVKALHSFSEISDRFQDALRREGKRAMADSLAMRLTEALLEASGQLYQARVCLGAVKPSPRI